MTLRAPRLERLRSIAELAKVVERPKSTLYDQLTKLHERDIDEGLEPWMFRFGPAAAKAKLFVNLSILRRAHPALFQKRFVRREELEAAVDRIAVLEARDRETRRVQRAHGAVIRTLRASEINPDGFSKW